ncbi:glycosyltransferase [Spongiibacter sp. KMU-158]|uniref:Glycosyltransferase n=1 Tax=Spongiibacter pelagi TaxID=2760804 RepID=A0A927GY58_9GAMM|nr:glycosyltransferase [Spongiibacter pelagi]MBD2860104.1 glycosyltransferase [Spongiibacter pelagi]
MKLSIVMVVKNEAKYIEKTIRSIPLHRLYELIVVDDGSEDETFSIVQNYCAKNISIFKNPGVGKVSATNFGFSKVKGDFVKFVDGDDLIVTHAFERFLDLVADVRPDVILHDALLLDGNDRVIGKYHIPSHIINSDSKTFFKQMYSVPKWAWTFSTAFFNNIVYPMPVSIPYEDQWFSLKVKESGCEILLDRLACYGYRQHSGQTFGGIENFNKSSTVWRARRQILFIEAFIEASGLNEIEIFDDAIVYNKFLSERTFLSYLKLLASYNWQFILKGTIIFSPRFYRILQRLSWSMQTRITIPR